LSTEAGVFPTSLKSILDAGICGNERDLQSIKRKSFLKYDESMILCEIRKGASLNLPQFDGHFEKGYIPS
jgi:hypothetical protein